MVLAYGKTSHDAIEVSLINLIATPEQYDGKLVRVIGVGEVKFESNGLYFSRMTIKSNNKNAVWLELDEKLLETTYEILKNQMGSMFLLKVFLIVRKKDILIGIQGQLIT